MSTITIAEDVRYVRASDVVATDMDGELVMMDVQQGSYFALTGSGPFIWEKLADPLCVGELVAALKAEYDMEGAGDPESLISEYLAMLLDKGLVRPAD
ncbi:PqqD family peptide modification chaperone [Erythrobacter sp. F6033]|uniref:PqqD family peptide modification chaperone n=1 Tax=Erythrobacter sp. F6033 TaxID=2926401 RepID=UPI001FF539A8|nr:PqqD family peptide modification chaperone [Erythrobacter sp. F6033]MCK0129399.1 PqqD family peptide modification chaperone [Erythrobacter sp. F6033]